VGIFCCAQERLADMPEEDLEDMDEDYMLVARMEAGLFTLQQCSLIMGHLWFYGDVSLRKRILLLLHQQACPLLLARRPTLVNAKSYILTT
jgi:beta-catenin-like protein 1